MNVNKKIEFKSAGPQNTIELEMLLQAYYMADGPQVLCSDAHKAAAERLVNTGVCAWKAGKSYCLRTTAKGEFYINHLMTISYPVETTTFVIPEAQS